jgi:hypothetical protein
MSEIQTIVIQVPGIPGPAPSIAVLEELAATAALTAADRVQTGLDRTATGSDASATAADRVQTGLDASATAADRVQTGLDASATAADRVQTGLDASATAADRVQTGLDRTAAETARDAALLAPPFDVTLAPFTPSGTGAVTTTVNAELKAGRIRPEQFGAVGDGIADDTAADAAARTKAGENGRVYYEGTYLISSVLDRPLTRSYGPGKITDGSKTWPVEEVRVPYRVDRVRATPASTVSDVDYSAFPNGIQTIDGRIVLVYHKGKNHGEADNEAICIRQSAAGAGNLTINGNEASGGVATIPGTHPAGSRVDVVSAGDDTGITFTISGTVGGVADTEVITGGNAVLSRGVKLFQTVTQVAVSGATASTVRVGFMRLPGDSEIAISSDGGFSWDKILLDGRTRGDRRYYGLKIGEFPNGDGVVLIQKQDLVTNVVVYEARRTFDGFRTFGPEERVLITGESFGSAPFFFGQIHRTPDGKLVCGFYSNPENGVATTSDGVNWVFKNIATDGATNYSEPTILPFDARIWLCFMRIDGVASAMRMFRTLNGGATWTDLGATNMEVGGGYVAPALGYVNTDAGTEVFSLIGRRQTLNGVTNPNTMLARFANVDAVGTNSWSESDRILGSFTVTSWASGQSVAFDEYRLYSNGQTYRALQAHTTGSTTEPTVGADWENFWVRFNPRGGYGCHYIDPATGEGWIAFGIETGWRKNSIRFQRVNMRALSQGNFHAQHQIWTPILVGLTTPGAPAYQSGGQYGRWTRLGPIVFLEFDIRIDGAFDGTGVLRIANLPFTCATANTASSALRITNGGTEVNITGEGVVNEKQIGLVRGTAGGHSLLNASMIGSGFRVEGSLVYMTKD